MNTPWTSGIGNRDPFAAFICDEATLDALRPVVVEMGWKAEKCAKGGLRNAVQALSVSASPAILLVDLSECGDPLNDINALAEVCEPGTVVIAVGQVNDVRLYRELMTSGIHDYLLKPVTAAQLRDALTQAQAVFAQPKHTDGGGDKRHLSTAVIGTRGGVGASTVATSLAWLFAVDRKLPTAILDLDVHFGTGALSLDLEPGRGLTDAIETPSRIDGLFLERAMIRADEHLAILSAEAPINTPLMTDGAAFVQLQEEFKQSFDMSVLDMPRNMLINFPQLMQDVQVATLVTELTLASARDTIRLISWLKTNAPHVTPLIVANKVQPTGTEIGRADFEASIERRINFAIPYDFKASANAAKSGETFVKANANTKAAQVMQELAGAIAGAASEEGVEMLAEAGEKSLLAKFDIKSLLSPKKARPSSGATNADAKAH